MSSEISVLVIEDEPSMREMLELALSKGGYQAKIVATLKEGIAHLEKGGFDVVLTDVKLPDGSGLDVILRVKTLPEQPPVLLMTAFGTTDMAVEAMKLGAFHYLTKPFKLEELNVLLNRAFEDKNLKRENAALRKEAQREFSVDSIIGQSKAVKKLFDLIDRVSKTKTNILITGESGTGKELIARAIHYGGLLKTKPFVTVNCGAIPENLMESEMFGHRRGSFTGAVADKDGVFQLADTGTIFLDEVGELPLSIQVKMLRVLQDRSFRAVGGVESLKVDVRVISATNRNLEEMVSRGEFREDLYYRLNVINIHSPTLRERRDDLPLLLEHFLRKFSLGMGKQITKISPAAIHLLQNYDYPGNIRELQNIMERAVALEGRSEISVDSLPPNIIKRATEAALASNALTGKPAKGNAIVAKEGPISEKPENPFEAGPVDLEAMVGDLEKYYILKALEKSNGVKKAAAQELGITFRSLRYRIAKYGITDNEVTEEDDEAI